jgi:hypothetical protein
MSSTGESVYIGHQVSAVSTTDRKLTEQDYIELYARHMFKTYHHEKDWWNSMQEHERNVWRGVALRKWPAIHEEWMREIDQRIR